MAEGTGTFPGNAFAGTGGSMRASLRKEDVRMSDQENREYTTDDILALPEGVRAELIDGKMYYMASPTMTHQRLIMGLSAQIYNHIREHDGG